LAAALAPASISNWGMIFWLFYFGIFFSLSSAKSALNGELCVFKKGESSNFRIPY